MYADKILCVPPSQNVKNIELKININLKKRLNREDTFKNQYISCYILTIQQKPISSWKSMIAHE